MSVSKRKGPGFIPEILASVVTGLIFIWASQNIPIDDLGNLTDLAYLVGILTVIGAIWWLAFRYRIKWSKKR